MEIQIDILRYFQKCRVVVSV